MKVKYLVLILIGLAGFSAAQADYVKSWDALTGDSWMYGQASPAPRIYAVNIATEYRIAFSQKKSDGSARGMNALLFQYGSSSTGHLETPNKADTFNVLNTGSQTITSILVLVAIDAASLPGGFNLDIGLAGQAGNSLHANDFAFYDPAASGYSTGRPSGYYSQTNPTGEPISYDYSSGMASVIAFDGLSFKSASPLALDYSFDQLPGEATFSVYGVISNNEITHTNRGLVDTKNLSGAVSTFQVTPEPATLFVLSLGATLLVRRKN